MWCVVSATATATTSIRVRDFNVTLSNSNDGASRKGRKGVLFCWCREGPVTCVLEARSMLPHSLLNINSLHPYNKSSSPHNKSSIPHYPVITSPSLLCPSCLSITPRQQPAPPRRQACYPLKFNLN